MSANVAAVQAEIERLKVGDLAPGLAQLALTLAAAVDNPGNVTAQSNAARELRTTLEELRRLAPPAQDMDRVDDLAKKRGDRIRARRA
ncbi:hypothetical protein [Streptomyces sp. PBH53]|uniref:hypothetical protein n=1 Tax=Streptomyces sp. PBH53 TaxID=1577075 RepID=UPI000A88AA8D|nr:hypothetical protein [Streptomyces sp. PBH53]